MKRIIIILVGLLLIGVSLVIGYLMTNKINSGSNQDQMVENFIHNLDSQAEAKISQLAQTEIDREHVDGVVDSSIDEPDVRDQFLPGIKTRSVFVISNAASLRRVEFVLGRSRVLVFSPTEDFGRSQKPIFYRYRWALFEREGPP